MVDTDNKSIRSRTAFDRLIDRESNHIFFKEMSRYANMEYGSTSLQGKLIILVVYKAKNLLNLNLTAITAKVLPVFIQHIFEFLGRRGFE